MSKLTDYAESLSTKTLDVISFYSVEPEDALWRLSKAIKGDWSALSNLNITLPQNDDGLSLKENATIKIEAILAANPQIDGDLAKTIKHSSFNSLPGVL